MKYDAEELRNIYSQASLRTVRVWRQGMFSTLFAKVVAPAQWFSTPPSDLSCKVEIFLEKRAHRRCFKIGLVGPNQNASSSSPSPLPMSDLVPKTLYLCG